MDIDIRVLGPVELWVDGHCRMSGAAKATHLLAALAMDVGRSVPLDTLADRLWDDSPPNKPHASLHSYATRIRDKLGRDRVPHLAHAYRLDVEPDAVDHHRYERLTAQARALAAGGDDAQALELLRQAESLWRGTPLTGFTGLWSEQVRRRLAEAQLGARVLRAEVVMRAGRFAEARADLADLAEQHPEDETVAALLLTAAYGAGRQSEALRAYETLRRRLRVHGAEPGEALVRVYHGILRRAPAGELLAHRSPAPAETAPNTLPAHSPVLIGRATELRALRAPEPGVVALQTVTGMPGVGKTQLALHAARRLGERYPAQVYINLQAHSGRAPLSPHAAMTVLLRRLGVPAETLPHDEDALAAVWRTVLGGRRALVVLDDAAGPEQVRPLLPGDSQSLVIVTSRRRLTGLPGVRHLTLDVLPPADAETLFTTLANDGRTHDPADVTALARLSGYLPLALELTAARLRSHPTWTASRLVAKLSRSPGGRLAEIRDGQKELTHAFAGSYDDLPPTHRRVFRLLGLHFAPTFCAHSTAALAGLSPVEAERVLEALHDFHLITEPAPERYELHDLLAVYARFLVNQEPPEERRSALDRLAGYYVSATATADRALFSRRLRPDLEPLESAWPAPPWADESQIREWLQREADALVAAELHLRGRGERRQAARLAHHAASYLDAEGRWAEAENMHTNAAAWWRSTGELSAEAHALLALVVVQTQTGRYEPAGRSAEQARIAAAAAGDRAAEAEALSAAGLVRWNLGQYAEARDLHRQALSLGEQLGDPYNIARYHNNLGIDQLHLGEHAPAMQQFREALAGFAGTRDLRGEAQALNNLGNLHHLLLEPELARTAFHRALDLFHRAGSRHEVAVARLNLAGVMPLPEQLAPALDMCREALAVFRQIGSRRGEAAALNTIGTAFRGASRDDESVAHHTAALAVAQSIGAGQEEVEALQGIGLAELHAGRMPNAAERLSAALLLAQRIGASEHEANAHTALADWHAEAHQYDEAERHLRVAHTIQMRLHSPMAALTLRRLRRIAST
ncbi:AfsR/SARP family transcriptional regulator [Actinacidiphila epipremni]|uniref:Tetratricopeptide repeat protein n=1 Tax=Actinacidiphila epipremni TaxID=2053013 RepID=A0ABX0ZSM6_9ACTN|nr:tetratricopeptide repeat protein [Actinacidiphila epipremni]NJP45990.1 tetratricopeptide repeat protein [Actinacidiphila epipremni]